MPGLTAEALSCVLTTNRSITYLSLEKSPIAANDNSLLILAHNCSELNTLSLAHCYQFTALGLQAVCSRCQKLTELSLGNCYDVSLDCLRVLARHCTSMQTLTLECTSQRIKTKYQYYCHALSITNLSRKYVSLFILFTLLLTVVVISMMHTVYDRNMSM